MSKTIYCIVGNVKTGKSSLCRALTGISKYGITPLQLTSGAIENFYVEPRSLQEKTITISDAIKLIKSTKVDHFIFCLRCNTANGCGRADDYIKQFIKSGFTIGGVAIIEKKEDCIITSSANAIYLNAPLSVEPTNTRASIVRKKWRII